MGSIATVVALVLAAALAHLFIARLMRGLLPLAALLRLTLIFPDRAPSRMAVALRANQAQQLRQRIENGVAAREDPPSQVAADLLAIVAFLTAHDRRTRGHAERVRAYADLIAQQLGFTPAQRSQLAWAALLHDVGKIGVPTEVLNKPGRLTAEELEAVRRHAAIGHCLVAPLADWLGEFARVPLEHHEYFDGTGYPTGLAGLDISLPARIVSVADAFDVMTSTRAYRRAGGGAAARAELVRCAGTQFDPVIVRAFLNAGVDVADGRGAAVSGALSPGWMELRWSAAAREVATRVGAGIGILSVGGAAALEPIGASSPPAPAMPTHRRWPRPTRPIRTSGRARPAAAPPADEDVLSLVRSDDAPGKLDAGTGPASGSGVPVCRRAPPPIPPVPPSEVAPGPADPTAPLDGLTGGLVESLTGGLVGGLTGGLVDGLTGLADGLGLPIDARLPTLDDPGGPATRTARSPAGPVALRRWPRRPFPR